MIMAGYGYYSWRKDSDDEVLSIVSFEWSKHLKFIGAGIVFTMLIGYLSTTYTDAKMAYMDAFVMVFSIIATWMLTQKVLENWLYWMVIDSVAIVLYWNAGYLATVVLFMIYVILGVYGYSTWRKEFNDAQ